MENENVSQPCRTGSYRWVICAMLFMATTINYIDRLVLGLLKPTIEKDLGWTQIDYGNIVFSFQCAYAIGFLAVGFLMDRIGVRVGLALSAAVWSLSAMAHGFVTSLRGFFAVRFSLGLSEAGNFPACIKTVAEWFPKKERALATGIFNSGTNVGAMITPIVVPWIATTWGWRAAFLVTGSLGFLWVILWWIVYRHPHEHPSLTPSELAYIRSDPPDSAARVPWASLFAHRQTWVFIAGKFMTDPIWYMWSYWIPDYLNKAHGIKITLSQVGPPMIAIYLMTDVGSIAGGWISSHLIKRGWTVNSARKTAMLLCALCVVPVFLASVPMNLSPAWGLWLPVLLIGLAASAHQGFSANLYTLVSDTVPRHAVSSVIGIGGMAGAVGGMFMAKAVGQILDRTHNNYLIPFIIASFAYLVALLVVHAINPRHAPMRLQEGPAQ